MSNDNATDMKAMKEVGEKYLEICAKADAINGNGKWDLVRVADRLIQTHGETIARAYFDLLAIVERDHMETDTMEAATMIDLTKFCAKDGYMPRWNMQHTFVKGGWRYATDGKIMVRILAPSEADTPENDVPFPPNVAELFDTHMQTGDGKAWPGLRKMVRKVRPCPQCGGDKEMGCDVCETVECLMCEDYPDGQFEQDDHLEIGEVWIAPKYAKLIDMLPNVRVFPHVIKRWEVPLPFKFYGGEGLIIGIRHDDA